MGRSRGSFTGGVNAGATLFLCLVQVLPKMVVKITFDTHCAWGYTEISDEGGGALELN